MLTTICRHKEKIIDLGQGIQEGNCTLCGQVRRYNSRDIHDKPNIIKLGRLNGAVVLPGPKAVLKISAKEAEELEAAKKEGILPENPPKQPAAAALPAAAPDKAPDLVDEFLPQAGKSSTQPAAGDEPPEPYVGKPRKYTRGVRKWGAKCKACKFSYLHDDILWCSAKRCS